MRNVTNWKDLDQNTSRTKVGLASVGILVGFAFMFFAIFTIAHARHPATKTASALTTTTSSTIIDLTNGGGSSNVGDGSGNAGNSGGSTASTTPGGIPITSPVDPGDPEGTVTSQQQLAITYPQSSSNLSGADFTKANQIATSFVQTDTSGVGGQNFPEYYQHSIATAWLTNLQIEWVFSTSPNYGVIQAHVWYTGTSLETNAPLPQVEQDVYLDESNNMQPINPHDLPLHGVTVSNNCCTTISPSSNTPTD